MQQAKAPMSDFWVTNSSSAEDTVVWVLLKAVMKGAYFSAIKTTRREQNSLRTNLQDEEHTVGVRRPMQPGDLTYAALLRAKR